MTDKVRLAPVGLGRWARVLARGAQRGDAVELYSCFSRTTPRTRTAFQTGIRDRTSAATYEELLADPGGRRRHHHHAERHPQRPDHPGTRGG